MRPQGVSLEESSGITTLATLCCTDRKSSAQRGRDSGPGTHSKVLAQLGLDGKREVVELWNSTAQVQIWACCLPAVSLSL